MILLLDKYPKSRLKQIIIWLKIFVKEGILLQDWKEVFRRRNKGGSIFIPQILKENLKKSIDLEHNKISQNYFDKVIVINDIECLRWAVKQKAKGQIGELIVGPFIQNHPHEYNADLLDNEIDKEIFFSNWHKDLFTHFEPKLLNRRLYTWFCGVDSELWKPSKVSKDEKTVLVYCKTHYNTVAKPIIQFLKKNDYNVLIITATKYSWEEYKMKLNQAQLAIFISVTETQGLAMLESWSMDVPTYHWNPKEWKYQGNSYYEASSCPYLEPLLGDEFSSLTVFKNNFEEVYKNIKKKSPRSVVLQKFTIEKSIELFKNILSA